MKRTVDKVERIRQIEYDLDRIRSLVERVDARAYGVMYWSGVLAAFYISLYLFVTESLNKNLRLLVADLTLFAVCLFVSFLFTMLAFVMSVISIYPLPYEVNVKGPKVKKGKTTLENVKKPQKTFKCVSKENKEGNGTSNKSEFLEFRDGYKVEILFEPKIKKIVVQTAEKSVETCQNMNINKILYDRCGTLHGQKLAVVRKYNWLRWALIFLVLSVVFLFISSLSLVF